LRLRAACGLAIAKPPAALLLHFQLVRHVADARREPDQPFLNKSLDKTADISGVEPKLAAQLAQIRAALPDLEQEPRGTKGAAAAQEMIVERADPLGDEAVELPDLGDLVGAHCLTLVK